MQVKVEWELDRSKPLQNQTYAPYILASHNVIHLSGLYVWEDAGSSRPNMGMAYLNFINSRGQSSSGTYAYLNLHQLARFCLEFLGEYEDWDGWYIRRMIDGVPHYRADLESQDVFEQTVPGVSNEWGEIEWTSDTDYAQIYSTYSIVELMHFGEVNDLGLYQMTDDMEFIPVALVKEKAE